VARYRASIDTPRTREGVFAYLSDFSTTQEWDPGVVSATRVERNPIGLGSEFHLVARFLRRDNALTYTITEYDPPSAVTFRGENASVISEDRITFEQLETGTRITYDAELRLKGVMRAADWFLGLAFKRVGDRALGGLTERLATGGPGALAGLRSGSVATLPGKSAA